MSMLQLIKLFPIIYSVWGGILIVAGLLIISGFIKIILHANENKRYFRRTDLLNCIAITIITTANIISLFAGHDAIQYILDALILGHFWCTMYYAALIWTQLRCLPALEMKVFK